MLAQVRGYPLGICLLLLSMTGTLAMNNLIMEMKDYNSSVIDLVCQYEGNQTDVFFTISKNMYKCIHFESTCQLYEHDCQIHCKNTTYPSTVSFLAKLDGSCDEENNIRCSVQSEHENLETHFLLTAQSDTPLISVNKGQPLKADPEPIPIVCTISNMCQITQIEIFGGEYMTSLNISHTKQGRGFTATAKTTAIFNTPGNYTITCKQTGKGDHFSRQLTVEVNEKVLGEPEEKMIGIHWLALAVILPVLAISIPCVICILYRRRRKAKRPSGERNEATSETERQEGKPLVQSETEVENGEKTTKQIERKFPKLLEVQKSICGIWLQKDNQSGDKISRFLKKSNFRVIKADIENVYFVQNDLNYMGYFAIVSSNSISNHNFFTYLISVLRRLLSSDVNSSSTFVLVVVDKESVSSLDGAQDNLIIDKHVIHWPINPKQIPRVDAVPKLDTECIEHIASKLQGTSRNNGILSSVGNIGIGFAWIHFQYHFAIMFTGMNIEDSAAYKKYTGRMSKYHIFVIPESYEISCQLDNGIEGLSTISDPNDVIIETNKIERAGYQPYTLKAVVHNITDSQGNSYYFCYKLIWRAETFKLMLESGDLDHTEMKRQFSLYVDTMRSILRHPHYQGCAAVLSCKDYTTLPDELRRLCHLIIEENQEPKTLLNDSHPMGQGLPATSVAEGLAWRFFLHYVKNVGPNLPEAMKKTRYYEQKKMPAKYFYLLPFSCIVNIKVEDAAKDDVENSGEELDHKLEIPVYKISNSEEIYYACIWYVTLLQNLREMETGKLAALTPMQRAAELRIFYEIVNNLLTQPSAPEYCSYIKLVYYDDDIKNSGRKLSDVLVEEIKECLQEDISHT